MARRWLAALVIAAAVAIAAPGALAAAQVRIGLNGGRPTEWPILSSILAGQGLTQQGWLDFASRVGENWLPGTTPVPLDYPGQLGIVSGPGALTADESTTVGQRLLHALILSELQKEQSVAVAGLSEGTLVIDRELAYLQSLPEAEAPLRSALTFYVFGDMLRGLGQTYLPGVSIPLIGQTFGPVPETRYDTVVVNEEWDGWANPPDRPWNLLAVLNAVMGAIYTVNGSNDHSQTSLDSLSDAVVVSQVKSTLGGTTTTYIVPRQQLPITRPLLQLGVPRWVVDELDKLLMPLIRAGYSSMTPELGPRIERGQLVFTPPAPVSTTTTVATTQPDLTPAPIATTTGGDPVKAAAAGRSSTPPPITDEARHDVPAPSFTVAEPDVTTTDETSTPPTPQRTVEPSATHSEVDRQEPTADARRPSAEDDEIRTTHAPRATNASEPEHFDGMAVTRTDATPDGVGKTEHTGADVSAPAANGVSSG